MKKISLIILSALLLNACTNNQNTMNALGTLAGATIGGVAGHQINHENGRYIGAAVGALAGATISNYMTQQQQQITQAVPAGVQVNRIDDATIQLNIQSEILFDTNQANIKPSFYPVLGNIANVLKQYPNTVVHIYGFTDKSGSDVHNQRLSEARAQSAAQFLMTQGVAPNRLQAYGLGERYAVAERNAADRKVEIYIRAIDQNNPNAAYAPIYR